MTIAVGEAATLGGSTASRVAASRYTCQLVFSNAVTVGATLGGSQSVIEGKVPQGDQVPFPWALG